jgi:hypothetical protein
MAGRPKGPRQKQMGVALPDDLRRLLEDACAGIDKSIAEEIRDRLWRTFQEDAIGKPLRNLMAEMAMLAFMTEWQTGQDCRTHPGANAVLRHALNAWLAHTKKSGPECFAPGELPNRRFVAPGSDDPQTIGLALEARLQGIVEHREEDTRDLLFQIFWKTQQNIKKDREQLPPAREVLPSDPTLPPPRPRQPVEEVLPPSPPASRPEVKEVLPPAPPKSKSKKAG